MMRTKDIHLAMNLANPVEELVNKFGFSSQEELYAEIRRITPQGSEELIRRLKRKSKKARAKAEAIVVVAEVPAETSVVEQVVAVVEEAESLPVEDKQENELKQLQKDEQELSALLCELEGEHKEIVSRRGRIVEQLASSKEALQNIRKKLQNEEKQVVLLCEEYNELAIRMQEVTHECYAHRSLLSDMRLRIAELQKIYIFVFEDGTIEVENAEVVSISNEEVDATFKSLVQRPDAEELTVKELKTIAKLKAMVKEYERRNLIFEINFGNPKVEKLFVSLP